MPQEVSWGLLGEASSVFRPGERARSPHPAVIQGGKYCASFAAGAAAGLLQPCGETSRGQSQLGAQAKVEPGPLTTIC